MKLLFDLFPVILFFATFKYSEKNPEAAAGWMNALLGGAVDLKQAPILLATVVVIAATVAQIAWVHFRHGRVDKMLWVSLGLVVVFGGLTLVFQDETFIKWKPTILYWVFAGSLAFAALVLRKNPVRAMLGEQLTLPDAVWGKVNLLLDGFLPVHGRAQPVRRLQFSDRHLGQFQALRRHGAAACCSFSDRDSCCRNMSRTSHDALRHRW